MRLCIGTLPIDILPDEEHAKKLILDLIKKAEKPTFVVTINPEIAFRAEIDRRVRCIIKNSSLNIIDGIGISKLIQWKLGFTPKRITGVDTIWHVLMTLDRDLPVFLYGAHLDVLTKTVNILRANNPNINIVGFEHGYQPWEAVATKMAKAQPRLILIALGAGRQELFMYYHLRKMKFPFVSIGVGGSFDVWSGHIERAPKKIQDLGLEWLWRNLKQPSRIGRLGFSIMYMITAFKKEVHPCED